MPCLQALGVSPVAEAVYKFLIKRGPASVAAIAEGVGHSRLKVKSAIDSLHELGLTSTAADHPGRYTAAPPDPAIELLALRRQEEVERARLGARALTDEFLRRQKDERVAEALIEVVEGTEAFANRYLQLRRSAQHELMGLDKPPYVTDLDACEATEVDRLQVGVRIRAIYSSQSLETGGQDLLHRLAKAGEEARLLVEVPLKLAIADRAVGLIPLNLEGRQRAVVVHASSLLDALIALFESLWDRATPLAPPVSTLTTNPQLTSLLAAGMKDQLIARHLGVGLRTAERRISELLQTLGAQTRFQAGFIAGKSSSGVTGPA